MNINKNTLVSDIVADNYKTATIFKNHKIDFCCNGNRGLATVALESSITTDELMNELKAIDNKAVSTTDYQNWELDFMSDYIYNTHHLYVEKQIPEILYYLDKICNAHANKHPELLEIRTLFNQSAADLTMHMKKEELILFPFIKKIAKAQKNNTKLDTPPFGTINNPINKMHHDHDNEGDRFRKIAELSNNYTIPKGGCTSYKVAFALLKDFEEDLHKHIHLENNILFKKAILLETTLNNK
ncbi:iron-sulfur cluster repair di-iron protein [Tenacibaculum aestuariivivum]|uniref:iron-sulfur cluster repair di-iron protein n=1 Tax=Tenacibaculum aestuariivivum TaxID=2006131 RepID=UPI003AB15046